MIKYILLCFLLLTTSLLAQDLNELYGKIENKISQDKNYLDIYTITFNPVEADIKSIPLANGGEFQFKSGDGVQYYFVFLKESIELDSLVIIEIWEEASPQAAQEGMLFGNLSATANDIKMDKVVKFRDMNELYFTHDNLYARLIGELKSLLSESKPESRLNLPIDEEVNITRGMSSPDNQDYLNYVKENWKHPYPFKNKQANLSRRERARGNGSSSFPVKIDFSFSHLTFYHEALGFGYSSLGFEANTESYLLNIQPWESGIAHVGLRSLTVLSGDSQNLKEDLLIDARIFARLNFKSTGFIDDLPFLATDPPKLNIGSGVAAQLNTTRFMNLPFINLYFATGSQEYESPAVTMQTNDTTFAYFSFMQWAATMSFYWNSSQERTLRFRMDIGAGYYDIFRVNYLDTGSEEEQIHNKVHPLVKFYVNFAPKIKGNSNELFSVSARYFDSIIKLHMWMKILDIDDTHEARLYLSYLSSPLYRNLRDWENSGSTMFGLRYRLGF